MLVEIRLAADQMKTKQTRLTDGLPMSLHLLLGKTERSAVIQMQVHLSLDVQNNLSGLESRC
jgi:hypothetical protein